MIDEVALVHIQGPCRAATVQGMMSNLFMSAMPPEHIINIFIISTSRGGN